MRVFERIRDWWRGPEVSADTSPFFVSNDDLVAAYEWLTDGGRYKAPSFEAVKYEVFWRTCPASILATLRKLGAA